MKVVVDADTKRILGAAILGTERRRGRALAAGRDVRWSALYQRSSVECGSIPRSAS